MRARLEPGLYEELLTEGLQEALRDLPLSSQLMELDAAEAPLVLARHLTDALQAALESLPRNEAGLERQVEICNRLLALLRQEAGFGELVAGRHVSDSRLLASLHPAGAPSGPAARPTISLSQSALLTNARGEPNMLGELSKELESADRVDAIVAFVKWHGVRHLVEPLRRFFDRGGTLRLITSTYMQGTDARAVQLLATMGADVRISYEMESTKLHAKAWIFHRDTGFSTGFIGSSNLSKTALVDGIEWNVRTSLKDAPVLLAQAERTFESYWHADRFEPYDPKTDFDRLRRALEPPDAPDGEVFDLSFLDIQPRPFQRRILELLEAERHRHNRWKNLVIAATGTGKTVIAALDYRRLHAEWNGASLLFVAHRMEILKRSLSTFRAVMRDGSFGELYVGGHRPEEWKHVFASIQSLRPDQIASMDPAAFDVVIVDEFHHAAAPTYRALLEHIQPRVLLGLTATPERADGFDVRHWFDGRFAAELRLWEALDEQLLVPFHYFGVHDDVDLSGMSWRRGSYPESELETLYIENRERTAKILQAIHDKIEAPAQMRALAFCVSVAHAQYMADAFNTAGLPARALTGTASEGERDEAIRDLRAGRINVLTTVDLFSEGVDVPEIDVVLFLRPTESATVFLQQLGRGLRHSEGKACLTVLDFVGHQHKQFRLDRRYRALTGTTRLELEREVEAGFPGLPPGCQLNLDRVTRDEVLANIRAAIDQTSTRALAEELRSLPPTTSLIGFLAETGLERTELYRGGRSFTGLRRVAGHLSASAPAGEHEIGRRFVSLLHADDEERLSTWLAYLRSDGSLPTSPRRQRLLTMLHAGLFPRAKVAEGLPGRLRELWKLPELRSELIELLEHLDDTAEHQTYPLAEEVPLAVHGRYRQHEILAAFDELTVSEWKSLQQGVHYVRSHDVDVFMVTLEKSEKHFSPTTMYRDYAISVQEFHWESQSKTSLASATGQRYVSGSCRPIIFARERRESEAGTAGAFLCLGRASYVRHEGENPIALVWRLDREMPADFFEVARVARA